MPTRYARRRDTTQAEIERALTIAGWEIYDFSRVGWGVPDLIIRRAGYKAWLECKSAGETLTKSEMRFHRICPGDVIVAYSGEQAVRLAEMAYTHYGSIMALIISHGELDQ